MTLPRRTVSATRASNFFRSMSKTYHDLLRQLQASEALTVKPAPDNQHAFELVILSTLLELMQSSDSDSVRVSAARTLIDQIKENHARADATAADAEQDRAAALSEIAELLEELAAAKIGGVAYAPGLDQDGAAEPAHTPG